MHSFTFGDVVARIDLSDYGLTVNSADINRTLQELSLVQLQNRAYSFHPRNPPRVISLRYTVIGTSRADLVSKLDNIKKVLATTEVKELVLDNLTDRYFKAILQSFVGEYRSSSVFGGTIVLVCPDPLGYATGDVTSHGHAIDGETIIEATEGTGIIMPVYTLTGGTVTEVITVGNLNTEEELTWKGELADGQKLEIDVAAWIVKKGVDVSMATVSGQFPRLLPAANNQIVITGFSVDGSLNIKYRNRYL